MRDTSLLGWAGILRLGVAQMALGALSVLATSTLNRILVVEVALPAAIPGLLIGLHYVLQTIRPGFGFASDRVERRGVWVSGGIAVLGAGVTGAAAAAPLLRTDFAAGLALEIVAYTLVGLGVGAAGTATLTWLASGVAPFRRAAAATLAWLLMILGAAVTAVLAGVALHTFGFGRLVGFVALMAVAGTVATALSVLGLPSPTPDRSRPAADRARLSLWQALGAVLGDPATRRFTLFVFASMLAYSGQELLLEPFAGLVFHRPPAATAALLAMQQGGALVGMLAVFLIGHRVASRAMTVAGCLGSAAALVALAVVGFTGDEAALRPVLFGLGVANGAFAVSAIGAMMGLAAGRPAREGAGASMGVFGAAQAVTLGLGGVVSSALSDAARAALHSAAAAYGSVFVVQAVLFVIAAALARLTLSPEPAPAPPALAPQSLAPPPLAKSVR